MHQQLLHEILQSDTLKIIERIFPLLGVIFIALQTRWTKKAVMLGVAREEPFLEITFKNDGDYNGKMLIKNLGLATAYSPSIDFPKKRNLKLGSYEVAFDRPDNFKWPMLVGDEKQIGMFFTKRTAEGISGPHPFSEALAKSSSKIILKFYNKEGIRHTRALLIKVGSNYNNSKCYLYTVPKSSFLKKIRHPISSFRK